MCIYKIVNGHYPFAKASQLIYICIYIYLWCVSSIWFFQHNSLVYSMFHYLVLPLHAKFLTFDTYASHLECVTFKEVSFCKSIIILSIKFTVSVDTQCSSAYSMNSLQLNRESSDFVACNGMIYQRRPCFALS